MSVRWTRQARAELRELVAWLSGRNRAAAQRARAEFVAAAELIGSHPGVSRPGRSPETRELSLPRWSKVIIYEETDSVSVIILTIRDTRRADS